ncbi:hypothetical protein PMAYCL1PPCAC_13764 [Pristionchus mayeri]|uniref:AMP-binding protein n=1 Tax=Pristionchus mayeri TaxID=1317129 RepID=A0AAN4ZPD6_9BILA|nr:hypothetical protein PMAYCL1PPCAC_13764 [Pristionchus mayeri]
MPWCIEPSSLRLTVLDERGEEKETLSEAEIEKEVSSMATVLATVPVDSLVSLRMDSRKETLLAMLALFRRGTPFIVVAIDRSTPSRWSLEEGRVIVENEGKELDRLEPGIAYSIYTSGTTGARKRIDVPEECIRLNIEDFQRRFSFSSSSHPHSILLSTSFYFDPSMVDVLLWATTPGSHLLLLEREASRSPAALPVALARNEATFVQLCPSLLSRCPLSVLQQLLQPRSQLRILLLGGESFPLHLINTVRHPDCPTRVFDVYGITEVSCWTTVADVPHGATTVTLGEPIDGTEIMIDDERRLLIGGARRRCFVDGVLEGEWTESGDRVEAVEGGGWRMEGREGDEVKLHGVRVNLAHSASQLIRDRADAIRFTKFVVHSSNFLVLFVQGDVSREEVDSVLPPGLSVHHIEKIDEVPLNSSGKADSRALLDLLEGREVVDEKKLMKELKRLDVSSPFNENCTLAELGMDSAGMLRLAFALGNEVCTRMILAGDVKIKQLREAIEGSGDSPSSSGIHWPDLSTINLDEDRDQRSLDGDQRSSVSERWSHPMEKCVDAAPLIVQRQSGLLIVIGSHSGLVVCMEEKVGEVATLKWSSRISHRVETAAVRVGEERIAVCSYDGVVSCFDVETGEEWWRHECAANVRGGLVAVDEFAFIGDYEGRLHKIDIMKRRTLWCTFVGGAMRATPTVEGAMVATVSIQGTTSVVDTESGAIVWSDNGRKRPIFASAFFLGAGSRAEYRLVTVDVDGHVSMRNAETGVETQSLSIDERVFSTPLQIESSIVIVTASDAGKPSSLLILTENLSPLKRIDFDSSSTVSIYHTPIIRNQSMMMMTSSGVLITVPLSLSIDRKIDGRSVVSKRMLPTGGPPIFSPPRFVNDDVIVLGTRDDVVVSLQF